MRDAFLGTLELARLGERFEDWSEAYSRYSKAAELQPDNAHVQERLVRVCEKLERPTEARAHYEKAPALDPKRTSAKEALAKLKG